MTRAFRPALLLGIVASLLPLAPASAAWTKPHSLERSGWYATSETDVAVSRKGGVVTAWTADNNADDAGYRVRFRRLSPTGVPGSLRTLSPASHTPAHVSVAVDDDGDAIVGWASYDMDLQAWQVYVRRVSRGNVIGPLLRVSNLSYDGWLPTVAMTPGGAAAVVYDAFQQQVFRRISLGNRLGRLTPQAPATRTPPTLVATRSGAFLTTVQVPGSPDRIKAVRINPDGTTRSRDISGATRWADHLATVETDRKGSAYVAYASIDTTTTPYRGSAYLRRWRADGELGAAHRLSPTTHFVSNLASATDLEGDTMVAWTRPVGDTFRLYARFCRRGGSLGPVLALGAISGQRDNNNYQNPRASLVLDDDGDGVITWTTEPSYDYFVVWARRVHRDGSLGPKVRLRSGAVVPRTATSPGGRVRVLMTRLSQPYSPLLVSGP